MDTRLSSWKSIIVYGKDQIFVNHSANTKSRYELKGNKIYSDTDKPDIKRYCVIESLTSDSLIVVGPYNTKTKLFVLGILYRLSYYRKRT